MSGSFFIPAASGRNSLWSVATHQPEIDPTQLADALAVAIGAADLDFRTRLLIRDSLDALKKHWGAARVANWLDNSGSGPALKEIWKSDLGPPGFPSLKRRLMDATSAETVLRFLRELGSRLSSASPVTIEVGGSIALILSGYLSRATEDIDLVDEIPPLIRAEHELLGDLAQRYGLRLAHFQSHFLPTGWRMRRHHLETLRGLDVFLLDPHDVWISKLFSGRTKDLDDLRVLASRLDKQVIVQRLKQSAGPLLAEKPLRQHAIDNWYIVFGEPLPADK